MVYQGIYDFGYSSTKFIRSSYCKYVDGWYLDPVRNLLYARPQFGLGQLHAHTGFSVMWLSVSMAIQMHHFFLRIFPFLWFINIRHSSINLLSSGPKYQFILLAIFMLVWLHVFVWSPLFLKILDSKKENPQKTQKSKKKTFLSPRQVYRRHMAAMFSLPPMMSGVAMGTDILGSRSDWHRWHWGALKSLFLQGGSRGAHHFNPSTSPSSRSFQILWFPNRALSIAGDAQKGDRVR